MCPPICLARRHVWYGYAAILLALLMVACGGGRHNQQAALPLAGNETAITSPDAPQTPATLAEALAQLDALAMPDGVAPAVWNELKGKLRSGLNDRFGGKGAAKIAAKAPTGEENIVKWICGVTSLDDEPGRLMWRYKSAGDYDLNGLVSVADVSEIGRNMGRRIDIRPDLERIDTSGNGVVDISDLTAIILHYGNECRGYRVFMKTDSGELSQVSTVSFNEGTVADGSRTFDVSCESWETADTKYYSVCPYDSGENLGTSSLTTYSRSYHYGIGSRVEGFPFVVETTPPTAPGSFVRWEFPAGFLPRSSDEATATTTVNESGDYVFFRILCEDGLKTWRLSYYVRIIPPVEIPIEYRKLSTPEGPFFYWSRQAYHNIDGTVLAVIRDRAQIAELPIEQWYYFDDTADSGTHAYKLVAKYGEHVVTSSETIWTGASAVEGEHLFLLEEPADYAGTSEDLFALVVNTSHPLWFVPSLRVATYGVSQASSLSIGEQWPSIGLLGETPKTASALEKPYRLYPWFSSAVLGEIAFTPNSNSAGVVFNWEELGLPEPETIPAHSTVLVGPWGQGAVRSEVPEARIMPTPSISGDSLFYVDAYRNMYRFEYVHNFRLDTYTVGPGIPTTPISGVMPIGKPPLYGDLNQDGVVGISDVTAIAVYFGPVNETSEHVDQNDDGVIGFMEFVYIWLYFGNSLPPT